MFYAVADKKARYVVPMEIKDGELDDVGQITAENEIRKKLPEAEEFVVIRAKTEDELNEKIQERHLKHNKEE